MYIAKYDLTFGLSAIQANYWLFAGRLCLNLLSIQILFFILYGDIFCLGCCFEHAHGSGGNQHVSLVLPLLLVLDTASIVSCDDHSTLILVSFRWPGWNLGSHAFRLKVKPDILLQSLESLGLASAYTEEDVDLIDRGAPALWTALWWRHLARLGAFWTHSRGPIDARL